MVVPRDLYSFPEVVLYVSLLAKRDSYGSVIFVSFHISITFSVHIWFLVKAHYSSAVSSGSRQPKKENSFLNLSLIGSVKAFSV